MSYLAIIYFPESEKRFPGLPFGMRGDRVFNYQIDRPAPKKTSGNTLEKIEQESIVIRKGLNLIEADKWELVQKQEINSLAIAKLVNIQALIIFTPDNPETAAQDTTDFEDESVVQEIVENANDSDWLNLCLNCDRRTSVRQILANRIRELQEEESIRRQQMVGSLNSMR